MKTTNSLCDPSQFQTTENAVEKGSSYFCFVEIVNKVLFCYSICSAFDLNILEQGYQLRYYRPSNYFKSGAVPCIAGCLAASPTFTHLIQQHPCSWAVTIKRIFNIAHVPLGTKPPLIENYCSRVIILVKYCDRI